MSDQKAVPVTSLVSEHSKPVTIARETTQASENSGDTKEPDPGKASNDPPGKKRSPFDGSESLFAVRTQPDFTTTGGASGDPDGGKRALLPKDGNGVGAAKTLLVATAIGPSKDPSSNKRSDEVFSFDRQYAYASDDKATPPQKA